MLVKSLAVASVSLLSYAVAKPLAIRNTPEPTCNNYRLTIAAGFLSLGLPDDHDCKVPAKSCVRVACSEEEVMAFSNQPSPGASIHLCNDNAADSTVKCKIVHDAARNAFHTCADKSSVPFGDGSGYPASLLGASAQVALGDDNKGLSAIVANTNGCGAEYQNKAPPARGASVGSSTTTIVPTTASTTTPTTTPVTTTAVTTTAVTTTPVTTTPVTTTPVTTSASTTIASTATSTA